MLAELTVREIGRISVDEALALTALIALKDPRRRSRVFNGPTKARGRMALGRHERMFT